VRLVYAGPFSSASIGTDSAPEAHPAASAGDKVLYDIRRDPNSYMKTIESGGTRTSPAQKVISFCNYPASLLYSALPRTAQSTTLASSISSRVWLIHWDPYMVTVATNVIMVVASIDHLTISQKSPPVCRHMTVQCSLEYSIADDNYLRLARSLRKSISRGGNVLFSRL
jgi:hypothetical protein